MVKVQVRVLQDLFTSGNSKKKQDGCCGLYYVRLTPLSSLYLNGIVVASVIREAAHTLVDDKEEAGLCSSSQAILLSYHEVFFLVG